MQSALERYENDLMKKEKEKQAEVDHLAENMQEVKRFNYEKKKLKKDLLDNNKVLLQNQIKS